jgi:hypothetical protein
MEENTFWIAIWRTVAATLVGLALTTAGCTANRDRIIQEMTQQGAHPMDARCAVTPDERMCLLRHMK